MGHDDGLMIGMFWGGLLVASVPILLTLGVGVYVLRRYLEDRRKTARARTVSIDGTDRRPSAERSS